MARLIGDTCRVGNYLRVCTEKTNKRVLIKGFSSLRNADGRQLSVSKEELPILIDLLKRAQFDMTPGPVKRDKLAKKRTAKKVMKKTTVSQNKFALPVWNGDVLPATAPTK